MLTAIISVFSTTTFSTRTLKIQPPLGGGSDLQYFAVFFFKWVFKLKMNGSHFVKNWPVKQRSGQTLQRLPTEQGRPEPWVYWQMSPQPNANHCYFKASRMFTFSSSKKMKTAKHYKSGWICLSKIHSKEVGLFFFLTEYYISIFFRSVFFKKQQSIRDLLLQKTLCF